MRYPLFAFFTAIAAVMAAVPLWDLIFSTQRSDFYSHIALIPLVTLYLLYLNRKSIALSEEGSWGRAIPFLAGAGLLYLAGRVQVFPWNQNDQAALLTLAGILFFTGGFIAQFGWEALRKNAFPFLFLVFMIPIPESVLHKIIYALQVWSTEVSEVLFALSGVPYNREGFVFQLPRITIEVAEVCSGIRSSLALFITSILAGHFFLDRFWKKTALAIFVFPVTVLKNGIRIVTLSLLGAYVDERILTDSWLHHSGGFVFFLPSLAFLGLALWALRRAGRRSQRPALFP